MMLDSGIFCGINQQYRWGFCHGICVCVCVCGSEKERVECVQVCTGLITLRTSVFSCYEFLRSTLWGGLRIRVSTDANEELWKCSGNFIYSLSTIKGLSPQHPTYCMSRLSKAAVFGPAPRVPLGWRGEHNLLTRLLFLMDSFMMHCVMHSGTRITKATNLCPPKCWA